MSLLSVNNLNLNYITENGIVLAVDGISFDLAQGEALGIVGESGSGKTSMSLALMRLIPRNATNYTGQVTFEGKELMQMTDEDFRNSIRWNKIAMVFQGAMNSLNPVLKVEHQIAEPLKFHGNHTKKEINQRVLDLLDMVNLPREISKRYPHELSGGMKQRVLIAMSLVLNPSLIILDEPTSALDVSIQAQIMNLLKRLKRDLNISFIFITHDIALASDISDKVAVMYAGEIVEIGTSEQIFNTPKHPYTDNLLKSLPNVQSTDKPTFIPGAPPDMTSPPRGCRFHPRCDKALEKCNMATPSYFLLPGGQIVHCWLNEYEK